MDNDNHDDDMSASENDYDSEDDDSEIIIKSEEPKLKKMKKDDGNFNNSDKEFKLIDEIGNENNKNNVDNDGQKPKLEKKQNNKLRKPAQQFEKKFNFFMDGDDPKIPGTYFSLPPDFEAFIFLTKLPEVT